MSYYVLSPSNKIRKNNDIMDNIEIPLTLCFEGYGNIPQKHYILLYYEDEIDFNMPPQALLTFKEDKSHNVLKIYNVCVSPESRGKKLSYKLFDCLDEYTRLKFKHINNIY